MSESIILQDEATVDYLTRTDNRTATLGQSTMELLKAFMTDGDDYETAKAKVQALSQEITASEPGAKLDYILGDSALLIATVDASLIIDQDKQDIVIAILNQSA